MYTFLVVSFVLLLALVFAGFLARVGTDRIGEIDANVASSFALLTVFGFVFLACSESRLGSVVEALCGGVPYLGVIADYGSLHAALHSDPIRAAVSFLDVVFLAALIDLINLLPLKQGSASYWTQGGLRAKFLPVRLLTGIVVALLALLLFNFVIRSSEIYQWIVGAIAAVISLISVCSVPVLLISAIKQSAAQIGGAGLLVSFLILAKSKVGVLLRSAFFKALIFTLGIWLVEAKWGSVAAAAATISAIVVAFMPAVICLIAIFWIVRSVLK